MSVVAIVTVTQVNVKHSDFHNTRKFYLNKNRYVINKSNWGAFVWLICFHFNWMYSAAFEWCTGNKTERRSSDGRQWLDLKPSNDTKPAFSALKQDWLLYSAAIWTYCRQSFITLKSTTPNKTLDQAHSSRKSPLLRRWMKGNSWRQH